MKLLRNYTLGIIFSGMMLIGCDKSNDLIIDDINKNDMSFDTYTYKGIAYEVYYKTEGDSVVFIKNKDFHYVDELLNNDNEVSILLQDNDVFIFDTEDEMLDYTRSLPKLKSGYFTSVYCYMWEHHNRTGKKLIFKDKATTISNENAIGIKNLSDHNFNNIITSIECSGPYTFTFYEKSNYSGKSFSASATPSKLWYIGHLKNKWHSGTWWWEKSWDNRVSSVKMSY
ncbi:MAG: hypothetical protein MI866_00890 [Bacteroidales bacterium]|nr:hypothetical protein [Bacteroidales bacterium]